MWDGVAGGEGDEPVPPSGLGPVRRHEYAPNLKHGRTARGPASRLPVNGQDALDYSLRVKQTSPARVGVDYDDHVYVVLRFHGFGEFHDALNFEIFHGYVVDWRELEQDQKNVLMRWGMADLKGRIK